MLGDAQVDEHGNITDKRDYNIMYLDKDGEDREINVSYRLSSKHRLNKNHCNPGWRRK